MFYKVKSNAFTLIELLVVIAIISLLVSILLPSLSKAKSLARRAVCLSTHRNLGFGFILYAEENSSALPYGVTSTFNPSPDTYARWYPHWNDMLLTQMGEPEQIQRDWDYYDKVFSCSEVPQGTTDWFSSFNWYSTTFAYNPDVLKIGYTSGTKPMQISGFTHPSDNLMLACGGGEIPYQYVHAGYFSTTDELLESVPGYENHLGNANFLFVDGHVASLNSQQAKDQIANSVIDGSTVLRD